MCKTSKMCKNKMCKNKMCKNSIWDLINSNINKRDERDVQTGLYWECTHSSNTDDENMDVLQLIMSLVNVYGTEFVLRSLMA